MCSFCREERSGGTAGACLMVSMIRKASNGAGCQFARWVSQYLHCSSPQYVHYRLFSMSRCASDVMLLANSASPLHHDHMDMGTPNTWNLKTWPVPFCTSRACCFPLDPQIIRAVFPYDYQRSKYLGVFWLRKKKMLYHTFSEYYF